MSVRVAVFHPGVQHAYETALAFQAADQLAWFATSIFYVPNRWPYRAAAFVPQRVRDRLESEFRRRFDPDLDPARVRTFGLAEWIERASMRLGLRRFEHYANELGNSAFARRVGRLAAAEQVDVLWGYDTASLGAFRRAKRSGIHCILEQTIGHPRVWNRILTEERERVGVAFDPYPRSYPEKDLAKVEGELALADRVVCGSEFVRQTLLDQGVPLGHISVVALGTIGRPIAPVRSGAGDELRLLFAGHFGIRKGAWYLLEAMRLLKDDRRITLTIVGKRTVPDSFLAPFGGRIRTIPHVPRHTMARIYERADVLVLPTLFEGSAVTIFEALASGLPVITTPNAGSVVRDGIEGFVVPIRDAAALAARIAELDADRGLLATMRVAARGRANEFPWTAYRQTIVRLVNEWTKSVWAA